MSNNERQVLTEIQAFALSIGDDEIALDCAAALKGDREALGFVRLTTERRRQYCIWAPAPR